MSPHVLRARWVVHNDNRIELNFPKEYDPDNVIRTITMSSPGAVCFRNVDDDNEYLCLIQGKIVFLVFKDREGR